MSQEYEEFDAEATCQAMQDEIQWQLAEWKQEREQMLEKEPNHEQTS